MSGPWQRTYGTGGTDDPASIAAAYLPQVERIARRMADTYGLADPSELVSASHVALWEIIQRYDPGRADLHRYVMVTVRQRLLDVIRQLSPLDHRQWQRLQQLREAVRRLEGDLGRPPTDAEVADALGVSAARLDELYRLEAQATSPAPLEPAEAEVSAGPPMDDQVALQATVEAALRKLPDREQRILYAVYVGGYTSEEIAQVLGLEASWVRRLRGRALAFLRAELRDVVDPGADGPNHAGDAKKKAGGGAAGPREGRGGRARTGQPPSEGDA
jgi:RNA polymerase sigma factor for flagellar operon FliA